MPQKQNKRGGDITRIERMVQLIKLFSRGKKFTTAQLKSTFNDEVSIRLIQRDLKELEEAGVEFIKEKGLGNENIWFIDPKFRTSLRYPIGESEYYSALFLKDALKLLKGTHLESAGKNLSQELDSLLPEKLLDEISDFKETNIFENVERGSYDYSQYGDIIEDLIHAILRRKICSLKYLRGSTGKEEINSIEPRRILQYDGALYIAAYQRLEKQFVPYAIHRIKELHVLQEEFASLPKFDSVKFRSGRFGIFGSDKLEHIELKFDRGIVYHIENRLWDESQGISYDDEGNLLLTMEIGITPELVSWILGWGKYCKILSPSFLASEIEQYY